MCDFERFRSIVHESSTQTHERVTKSRVFVTKSLESLTNSNDSVCECLTKLLSVFPNDIRAKSWTIRAISNCFRSNSFVNRELSLAYRAISSTIV
jgi:hypothetical protein